jgi:hypothetical protein
VVDSVVVEQPDLLVATVSGVLTPGDQSLLVTQVRKSIQAAGRIRVLLLLERFAGWNPTGAVDNVTMWLDDDASVTQMAIAGEARWKMPLLTMAAQPLRRFPIEYFESEADARQWLNAGQTA